MKTLFLRIFLIALFILPISVEAQDKSKDHFYFQGAFYLDWYGIKYQGSNFLNQISSRIRFELFNRRGSGWTLQLDARNRFRLNQQKDYYTVLYDASLIYENSNSPLYFSAGQMNLYDTAGIGQLLGGIIGIKPVPSLLIGGYAGLKANIYIKQTDKEYRRFGFFSRYLGSMGKRFSLSYNHIYYSSLTEKQYMYFNGMYPIKKILVLFGSAEYQLSSNVSNQDRLSRLFFNARFDPSPLFDISGFFSSGKGLDFHQYILESSQDPSFNDKEIERYYYSKQYGLRASVKPIRNLRLTISRMETEQSDKNIKNHSWMIGGSAQNIFKTGFSTYGSYRRNQGELSESDSFDISISKEFGKISWNTRFSNTYNSIRFESNSNDPELIHKHDYKTLSMFFFIVINRSLALSVEYEYFLQEEADQHLTFVRLIYRKY